MSVDNVIPFGTIFSPLKTKLFLPFVQLSANSQSLVKPLSSHYRHKPITVSITMSQHLNSLCSMCLEHSHIPVFHTFSFFRTIIISSFDSSSTVALPLHLPSLVKITWTPMSPSWIVQLKKIVCIVYPQLNRIREGQRVLLCSLLSLKIRSQYTWQVWFHTNLSTIL